MVNPLRQQEIGGKLRNIFKCGDCKEVEVYFIKEGDKFLPKTLDTKDHVCTKKASTGSGFKKTWTTKTYRDLETGCVVESTGDPTADMAVIDTVKAEKNLKLERIEVSGGKAFYIFGRRVNPTNVSNGSSTGGTNATTS